MRQEGELQDIIARYREELLRTAKRRPARWSQKASEQSAQAEAEAALQGASPAGVRPHVPPDTAEPGAPTDTPTPPDTSAPGATIDALPPPDTADPDAPIDALPPPDTADPGATIDTLALPDTSEPDAPINTLPHPDTADPGATIDTLPPPGPCGTLRVRVSAARGAQPVEGALVTVSLLRGNHETLLRVMRTDADGCTPDCPVPLPHRDAPAPGGEVHIRVDKPGFFIAHATRVAVYEGAVCIQRMRLIPLPEHHRGSRDPQARSGKSGKGGAACRQR